MAFSYSIPASANRVNVVARGRIAPADCLALVLDILGDPHYDPDSTALVDVRNASYDLKNMEGVPELAEALRKLDSVFSQHIAIVARKSMLFPAEVFAACVRKATNAPIKVFMNIQAAEQYCRNGERQAPSHNPRNENLARCTQKKRLDALRTTE